MLNKVIMPKSVILYWDLPDNYNPGDTYTVFLNGKNPNFFINPAKLLR